MNLFNLIYIKLRLFGQPLVRLYYTYLTNSNPKRAANHVFKKVFGRSIDWEHPTTYNEIINCEKILLDTTEWSKLADKYRVREYIKERGFEDLLVKIYGVWDRVDDINFTSLPDSFVLKLNNGSGTVLIIKDIRDSDVKAIKRELRAWMKSSFGYENIEPHYLRIKPLIIAEELLDAKKQTAGTSKSLIDYKWFCFRGHVSYVEVVSNRTSQGFDVSIFDKDWREYPHFVSLDRKIANGIDRPANLDKMIAICEVLSKDFSQVRVDLYEVDGKIYFGELTFTSGAGYSRSKTDEFDHLLADLYYQYNSGYEGVIAKKLSF